MPQKGEINAGLAKARTATQFKKGNQASKGHGHPSGDKSIKYYLIAMRNCSFEEWGAIVRRAVADALDGDRFARKWLGDYLMGPPTKKTEISGPGGAPIQLANATFTEDQRLELFNALLDKARERREMENVTNVIIDQ